MSGASPAQVLPQGAGWAVVVGLGFAFAGIMMVLAFLQEKFTRHSLRSNVEFNNASHSVKPGLIGAGIVSAWTWAATLLQSTSVTYTYGVSGAYWYSSTASQQILLCAIIACKMKTCAPYCSTFLEVVRIRFGRVVHLVFVFFSLATNLLVSSQLVLGGAAVVNELTGMNTYASLFLIPISVAVYTVTGGLRATFIGDYLHTVGLFVIIIYFFFNVWTGHGKIGSLTHMVEMLNQTTSETPIDSNAGGSLLTFRSRHGLVYGVINICAAFATVFTDQSYHQRSIASQPKTASLGFFLGGAAWFPIPFVFATSMGLAARALMHKDPAMATLTTEQVTAGLTAPAAAVALCGKSGAVAMLILLFLAVTSASSAQQIAVSSVFTFDVYKTYLVPNASPRHIHIVTHLTVVAWALIMAAFGVIWNAANISLGWLFLMMGIIVAPAVFPIFGSLVWSKTNGWACVAGMLSGLGLGIMAWMVTTQCLYSKITVDTTGMEYPNLAGNLVSLCVSTIVTVVLSLIWPQNYDFAETRAYNAPVHLVSEKEASGKMDSVEVNDGAEPDPDPMQGDGAAPDVLEVEKGYSGLQDAGPANIEYVRAAGLDPATIDDLVRRIQIIALVTAFILIIAVPAVATSARTWNAKGLGAWIYIGFVWLCFSIIGVGILPIWESRQGIALIARGIFAALRGQRRRAAA